MLEYTIENLDEEKTTLNKVNPFGEYKPESFWTEYGKKYRQYFETSQDGKNESSIVLNLKDLIGRIFLLKPLNNLEVGCGFGRIMPSIVENLNLDAYGIDFSQTMIDDSVKYYKDYVNKNRIHIQHG